MRARKWVTDPQAARVRAEVSCPLVLVTADSVVSHVSQFTSLFEVVPGGRTLVMTNLLSVILKALISISHSVAVQMVGGEAKVEANFSGSIVN